MIKMKKLVEGKFSYNRKFGDALPTLDDFAEKHQAETIDEEKLNEISTGWKKYKVYDISDKLWKEMKYDLRDQFDELVKIGEDYSVFQNAQGTSRILKQIQKLMHKL